ncbi:MAG: YciI family protein [Ilumatobacteraceae bacterium]
MRFLMAVIDSTTDPGRPEAPGAVDAFNVKIEAAGQRIIAAGVAAPNEATVFDNRQGSGQVSSGPAVETDAYMAGFWVIEVPDRTTAEALAAEASLACNRRIELRPFLR